MLIEEIISVWEDSLQRVEEESDKEKQKKYYPMPELAADGRVKSMEEYKAKWQASVDGFRRQVNQSLLQLRETLAQAQATP